MRATQWTADPSHGPLPLLLLGLTVVTGLVDALSYLRLGHVFVANMTGNVVFLGFGLAGVGEISIVACLLAILAFALGATLGGRWAAGRALHRGHLLAAATSVQAGAVLVASVIASTAGVEGPTVRLTLIGLLSLAMGGQNAVVRRLAVPDLTTTVLTLTVTGLVADTTPGSVRGRRLISVLRCSGVRCWEVSCCAGSPPPRRSGWPQYCWSPALQAPMRPPAAHNRRPGGSPTMTIRTAQQPGQESPTTPAPPGQQGVER